MSEGGNGNISPSLSQHIQHICISNKHTDPGSGGDKMSGLEDAVYQLLQQLKLDQVEEVARNIKVNIIQQVLKKISQRSLNKVLDPILRYAVI